MMYPYTKIFKRSNVQANANKSPWGSLLNMTPNEAYSIPIHVRKTNLVQIIHKQKE